MLTGDATSVLLLEDDEDFQLLLKIALRKQAIRYEVDCAETVEQACNKLGQHPYDVILTDLSVPDSHGFETVSRLKQMGSKSPIIVLTGNDDPEIEKSILTSGAQDYLVKQDFNPREIHRTIQHALQRQECVNRVDELVSELTARDMLLKEQAEMLRGKNAKLHRLYKTAQEFVDNVSHDLRTPLTVIKDYVGIIREGMVGEVNDEQQSMLDKVSLRADDLNNMVDDLLDVSKLDSGLLGAWRRAVGIDDVIQRVEHALQERAAIRGIDFAVECDEHIPELYCDADKVARVIGNLAVNALKFVGDNGRVRLWVRSDPANQQVIVGVTDNGPGIDPQSLEQMFRRFRQLDCHRQPGVKGFGLGLNIAQQLCRLNLGELSVESRVGEGSTFTFTLPIADPKEVFGRWVGLLGKREGILSLIEITLPDQADVAEANDYDSFFTSQLRKNDLLFRAAQNKWYLVLLTARSEQDVWFTRSKKECDQLNRNRLGGPLPPYDATSVCSWGPECSEESILAAFEATCQQAGEPLMLA